jgi:hypothetical protein
LREIDEKDFYKFIEKIRKFLMKAIEGLPEREKES